MAQLPQIPYASGVTAGTQLFTDKYKAIHLVTLTPAAASATAVGYDNTSATGTPVFNLAAAAGGQAIYPDLNGLVLNVGLFVVVTGAGAALTVYVE